MLGPVAGEVRVHRGPDADARLAGRPGALAVTEGADIHVGWGAPPLDSPGGRLLLAHEAAHVLQQRAASPRAGTAAAEAEADEAAVAAVAGRQARSLSAADGPQFFEAPWHAATPKTAMDRRGFSDAEQDAAYFANWCRDLSQALVPTLEGLIGRNATFDDDVMDEIDVLIPVQGSLRPTATVGTKAAADRAAEGLTDPRERFRAEVDRTFGHPYDSNWWVPTVQAWTKAHQYVLAQYIRDRNSGRSDVH